MVFGRVDTCVFDVDSDDDYERQMRSVGDGTGRLSLTLGSLAVRVILTWPHLIGWPHCI